MLPRHVLLLHNCIHYHYAQYPHLCNKSDWVKFGRVDGEGVSSMQIHQFPFPIIPHVNCLLLCVRTLETIPPQKLFFVDIPQYPQF